MGFDLFCLTPAPKTSAALSLESFTKFGNVCKSTEMALFSSVPRIAIDFGINIIFWGENPALIRGDSAVQGEDEFDGNNLRELNTLRDGGYDWMKKVSSSDKVGHYFYPEEELFNKKKISIFYLSPAWEDFTLHNNSLYASLQGLTLRPDEELITGDISNASMLDEEFTNINYMIRFYKYGIGRAADFLSEKIREKLISKEEASGIRKSCILVRAYSCTGTGIGTPATTQLYYGIFGFRRLLFFQDGPIFPRLDLPRPKIARGIQIRSQTRQEAAACLPKARILRRCQLAF